MAIPESQLETWSHQGAVAGSSATYQTIKSALESPKAIYKNEPFTVFLQGSYGNATNIYAESDVDIIIRQDNCFFHNIADLGPGALAAFNSKVGDATYPHPKFRSDVITRLTTEFGTDAKEGDKAVAIAAGNGRRKADVIIAAEYRRYSRYVSETDNDYITGISFWTKSGTQIINFPAQHSANCTTKHQNTNQRFKPMVRTLKNVRSKLVEKKLIVPGLAPSYYLEGLLWNVPNNKFVSSIEDTFVNCINYALEADRSKFACANDCYYLLNPSSPVTWRAEKCTAFLDAVVQLWKNWP